MLVGSPSQRSQELRYFQRRCRELMNPDCEVGQFSGARELLIGYLVWSERR
jgi:hypothetical protein